jgi:hypothetical protein
MKLDFRFDPDQDEYGSILIYKMRRKGSIRSDHQSNIDPIYAKFFEEASKMMRLLITWKINRLKEPKVNVILVEYDNRFVLNEDKLVRLYDKINVTPSNYDKCTWLMYDDTTLEAKYEVVWREGLELKITIYKGSRDSDTIRPMWIDSER